MEIFAPDGKQTSEELNWRKRDREGRREKRREGGRILFQTLQGPESQGETILPVCSKLQMQGHKYLC
jgi:hypothetical protein